MSAEMMRGGGSKKDKIVKWGEVSPQGRKAAMLKGYNLL